MGSNPTRDQTRVPCIARLNHWILNHWTISEVQLIVYAIMYIYMICNIYKYITSFFNLITLDLQCYVSFRCTAKWFGYIYLLYIYVYNPHPLGFPDSASSKEPTCQCRRHKRCRLDPWVGKIPCRRKRQPTSVFLLGNPMNGGAWESTVHRVAKSWTRLKRLSLHACIFFFQVFFPCRLL